MFWDRPLAAASRSGTATAATAPACAPASAHFRARTQSSIAVCGRDSSAWVLVNASPDILAQLKSHPELQPARTPRDTAITGIVLADGQIDHTTGLFMLRESVRPLAIWCTDQAHADLTRGNPIFEVLGHYCGVDRRAMSARRHALQRGGRRGNQLAGARGGQQARALLPAPRRAGRR